MIYLAFLFMQGLVLGFIVVASNPSPYFAVFGLVAVAGMGCGLMVVCGGIFLSLVLFLIYLGGMLVVFAYSSALASEPYPETWGSPRVALNSLVYGAGVCLAVVGLWGDWAGGLGGGGFGEWFFGLAWGFSWGCFNVLFGWVSACGWCMGFTTNSLRRVGGRS
uniref:NADH-ubiquinone oxidoreductase chain 6 n=1 Tax=Schismatogobius ampluvinculus TaxID=1916784 RepID=A0A347Z762_9GOBI|nr:NADH dehydrogenase subunit 6 [Schismatogobius ampluvinculus]